MEGDWTDNLSPDERAEWDRFVDHQRKVVVKAMDRSAYVMSLMTDADEFDAKFAIETGMAIMLDKPIVLLVMPSTKIPFKLRKVADEIITADLDTEQGQEYAARRIREFSSRSARIAVRNQQHRKKRGMS